MANRSLGHFLYRRIVLLTITGALAACGQSGGGGLFQPGQIVGGGTKEIRDVQPVAGFLPNASLLQPGGSGRAALVYRNPTADFSRYNKVLLDPVTICCQMVTSPSPGTLRLKMREWISPCPCVA
jgi:hypothetical protein